MHRTTGAMDLQAVAQLLDPILDIQMPRRLLEVRDHEARERMPSVPTEAPTLPGRST